ncbi:MAG: YbhB/YbcL family Raf kinase inhibitor-like protein [Phycisphaerae bacterium]
MKRFALIVAGLAALLAVPSASLADLCKTCAGKMYIMSVGECEECDGHTSSGAHKLCKACSMKLNECEHCRAKLGDGKDEQPKDSGTESAKPGDTASGKVKDDKLRKLAPESGFIADAETLKKLLKAWDADKADWTTDFTSNVVLVGTADGPNVVHLITRKDDDGKLKVMAAGSRMAGPGFGWAMKVVSREGVKTVNGKKLPAAGGAKLAQPGEGIAGTVKDDDLKKLAPDGQAIVQADRLAKLLKAWGAEDPNWTTDFSKNFVVVATADGPNRVLLGTKKEDGNLKITAGSTLMAGPGFGWAMKVVSREGVKTVNGKPLPAADGQGASDFDDLDFSKDGSAVHGLWAYHWATAYAASAEEGNGVRIGRLLYAGKPVPVPEKGDKPVWQQTPWGMATHSHVMKDTDGWHGWLFAEPALEQPSMLPVPVMLAMGKDFNPFKTATHKSGDWAYEYVIENRGTWSVKRTGKLTFDGKAVDGKTGQWMITPWGVMQKLDARNVHGWLPQAGVGGPLSLRLSDQLISPLAKRRVEALKKDLDNLTISVTYRGPDAGKRGCPLSALLHTDDAERSVLYGTQLLKIDKEVAGRLIHAMARGGILDVAIDARRMKMAWPKGPVYMIGVDHTGRPSNAAYVWNAGWGLTTLDHIRNLAQAAGYNEASRVLEKVVPSVPDQQVKKWTRKATRDAKMKLQSPAFEDGQDIPEQFTGEGKDVSPALKWDDLPDGTKELALICNDPDAPREEPWVHWVIYNIPSQRQGLPEGLPRKETLQEDMYQGTNSWDENNLGYRGPMPPKGHGPHRYIFTLYALDADIDIEPGKSKQDLLKAMEGHILAATDLTGVYERK